MQSGHAESEGRKAELPERGVYAVLVSFLLQGD